MAKFKSVPHEIEAFQFTNTNLIPPQWFMDAVEDGKASVTISDQEKSITVYGEHNTEKAKINWWVCKSDEDKIYVLDDKSFRRKYQEA